MLFIVLVVFLLLSQFGWALFCCKLQILETSFAKILSQLRSSDIPSSVMDMAEVFIPFLPAQSLEEVFKLLSPMLDVS